MGYSCRLEWQWPYNLRNTDTKALPRGPVDGEPISDKAFTRMLLVIITARKGSSRKSITRGTRLLMEHMDQLE